jgi:hypothetical protein
MLYREGKLPKVIKDAQELGLEFTVKELKGTFPGPLRKDGTRNRQPRGYRILFKTPVRINLSLTDAEAFLAFMRKLLSDSPRVLKEPDIPAPFNKLNLVPHMEPPTNDEALKERSKRSQKIFKLLKKLVEAEVVGTPGWHYTWRKIGDAHSEFVQYLMDTITPERRTG